MRIPVRWLICAAAALVVAWVFWLVLLWQPARQIELHTANLLARASVRDWAAVTAMMSPDYRDAWGHGRTESVGKAEDLFNNFFTLQILPTGPMTIRADHGVATNAVPLGIFGSGTPVAHAIMDELRETEGPFVFCWRKSGAWPWQWLLVEVSHAELAALYPP